MQDSKNISNIHEGMIVSGMSQCLDLIISISENLTRKEAHIFVEHLALSLRELSFYVDKYFGKKLDKETLADMENIKDIRDAICHRSSPMNLLSPSLYLSGGFNFKDDDVEVRYGKTKILLKKGMVDLYLNFRRIITSSRHFSYMKKHPSWNIQEKKIEEVSENLIKALSTRNVVNKIKETWK